MKYQLQIGIFDKPLHNYEEMEALQENYIPGINKHRNFTVTETYNLDIDGACNFVSFLLGLKNKTREAMINIVLGAISTKDNTQTIQEGEWYGWRLIEIE